MSGEDFMATHIPLRRRAFYLFSALWHWWEGGLDRLGLYRGACPTPHMVKRRVVREYAERYGTAYFVETGTYHGDMIAAMLRRFDRLYSIELSVVLHEKAKARFARHDKVRLLQGDSAVQLQWILPECDQPTLFWLDAHWSGCNTARGEIDSPILAELEAIFGGSKCKPIILVDDARCFVGIDGYPKVEDLRVRVAQWVPGYELSVERDIIRIVPGRSPSASDT